ncbi:MAG: hypothetical protein ACRDPK_08370 [Carbonactinosporaceae bacterium]
MEEWLLAGMIGVGIGYALRGQRRGAAKVARAVGRVPVVGGLARRGQSVAGAGLREGAALARRGIGAATSAVRPAAPVQPPPRARRAPRTTGRARRAAPRTSTTGSRRRAPAARTTGRR